MHRAVNRIWAVILLAVIFISNIYSSSLSSNAVLSATHDELIQMALLRDLETKGKSDDEIKKSILDRENLVTEENSSSQKSQGEYSMNILSADKMTLLENKNVLLEGNVKVSFSFNSDDPEKILSADKMIVDNTVKSVSAYSNVKFEDKNSKSGLSDISADVVTYSYNDGDLVVTGGSTQSERTNNEKTKITFNTSASLLNYRNTDSGLYFLDGYITTDKDKSLSTISAKEIAILDGGDMFLSNAYLKIGRVPLLYIPFFFYPGSRLTINPAFGFSSSRGLFASTTFEVFGKYPNFENNSEESSFASLLKSGDDKDLISNGLYYDVSNIKPSPIQEWAKKSGSYLTLLLDAYEKNGLHAGYDLLLKSNNFKLSSKSGISYSNSITLSEPKIRYYSNNQLDINLSNLNLKASFPFYSDPYSYSDYSGRLTSFSIDSFLGGEQKFPSGSSNVTSYEAYLDSSLSMPKKYLPAFIDSARISSLSLKAKYAYSSYEKSYLMEDIYLPKLNANISGTIFSYKSESIKKEEGEKKEIAFSDYFILTDPLLSPMYEEKNKSSNSGKVTSISLKYSINEELNNSYENKNNAELTNEVLQNKVNGKITLQGNLSDYFSLVEVISPEYSYSFKEESNNEKKDNFTLRSDTTINLSKFGLTYNFNTYLYRLENTITDTTNNKKETIYSFDKENVKSHSLSFSKSYEIFGGKLSPTLKYTIPPLNQSITAGLSYKVSQLTFSLSWNFKEENNVFKSDDIKFSFGALYKYFTSSLSLTYKSANYDPNDFLKPLSLNSSISLRSEDKKYSLTEYLKYTYETNKFDELTATFVSPYLKLTHTGSMTNGLFKNESFDIQTEINSNTMYAYYNRILTKINLNSKFHYAFDNIYATNLSISLNFNFKIQEFLAINFSIVTRNNSFYKYYDNDKLDFSLLYKDLLNSFDFLSNGRYNTGFNMDSLSIELIHYMSDWDLYCKYSASIVSSSVGYEWVPTVSIFLKWKTIPDLKVDENYKKTSGNEWTQATTVYGKK